MTDKEKLKKAIEVIKTLKEDAKLALSGHWNKSDEGFQDQLLLISKFFVEITGEPKGKLKQGKLKL